MNTNTTKISNAAIILADVPYIAHHPHQHYGTHFYVVVSNPKACAYAPVVQAIPVSSNIHRTLPPREILERGRYCGQLGEESMARLRHAIKIQLALD